MIEISANESWENPNIKPQGLPPCYITTKLDFGASITNATVHKNYTNTSADGIQNFIYEAFIEYSEKNTQRIYFSNETDETHNVISDNYIIDELFNYINIFDMDMKCNPCYSLKKIVIFYGHIRIFTPNTNIKYRSFVIKIVDFSNIDFQKNGKKNVPFDDVCYYRFGIHSGNTFGNFHVQSKDALEFGKNASQVNYYYVYDAKNSKLFKNMLQKISLKAIALYKKNNTEAVIDFWTVNNIKLEPYKVSNIYNMNGGTGILKISFSIFFTGYGFTGANLHLDVNKRDPINKIRLERNRVVCADPNKEGQYCTTDKSKCKSRPCESRTNCIGTSSDFLCKCSFGNFDKICKTNLTYPSLHNFKCKNQYNCLKSCNPGWSGEQCNERACIKNTCKNYSTCNIENNRTTCICDPRVGYGQYCQYKCRKPCVYGICSINNNEIECVCDQYHGGFKCDLKKLDNAKILEFNIKFYIYIIISIIFAIIFICVIFYNQIYFISRNDKISRQTYLNDCDIYTDFDVENYCNISAQYNLAKEYNYGCSSSFYSDPNDKSEKNGSYEINIYQDLHELHPKTPTPSFISNEFGGNNTLKKNINIDIHTEPENNDLFPMKKNPRLFKENLSEDQLNIQNEPPIIKLNDKLFTTD